MIPGTMASRGQHAFSFFAELPLSKEDTATMNILQEAQAAKVKPVFSFFALQSKKTDKGYAFEADSKKELFLVRAVGARATRLTQVVESLQGVPQASRDVLEQYAFQGRDYENELGAQTLCKLLSDLTAAADVQKLNEKPTVWTANWIEVGWPVGDNLLKKDGSELFFQPQRSSGKRVDEREKRLVAFKVP